MPARAGEDYVYVVGDDELPDPASRHQPEGLRGPSRVVDPRAFAWTDEDFVPRPLHEQVIYELHIGTFTPAGTFDAAIEHLPELARARASRRSRSCRSRSSPATTAGATTAST